MKQMLKILSLAYAGQNENFDFTNDPTTR